MHMTMSHSDVVLSSILITISIKYQLKLDIFQKPKKKTNCMLLLVRNHDEEKIKCNLNDKQICKWNDIVTSL